MKIRVYHHPTRPRQIEIRYQLGGVRVRESVTPENLSSRIAELETGAGVRLTSDQVLDYSVAVSKLRQAGFGQRNLVSVVEEWLSSPQAVSMDAPVMGTTAAVLGFLDTLTSQSVLVLYTSLLSAWAKTAPALVSELREEHVRVWLSDPSISRESRKNRVGALRRFLAWLPGGDTWKKPLLDAVEKQKRHLRGVQREQVDPQFFSVSEFRAMLRFLMRDTVNRVFGSQLQHDVMLTILLQGFCGLRLSEVQRITWLDFKLTPQGGAELLLGSAVTKTGRRRVVPVPCVLMDWFKKLMVIPDDISQQAKPVVSSESDVLLRARDTLASQCGFVWKRNGLRKGFVSHHVAIHGVKHTAAVSGHSEDVCETWYKGLVTQADAKDWFDSSPKKLLS